MCLWEWCISFPSHEAPTANGFPGELIIDGNVLVEVNAAVRELAELSSLLDLCRQRFSQRL
jgi:hypothetical protein